MGAVTRSYGSCDTTCAAMVVTTASTVQPWLVQVIVFMQQETIETQLFLNVLLGC